MPTIKRETQRVKSSEVAAPFSLREPPRERINIHVYHTIIKHSKAKGARLAFLLALAQWADDAGVCYPSLDTIADCCHVKRRALQYTIAGLVAEGELEITRGGGRHQNTNQYRICCVGGVQTSAQVQELVETGAIVGNGQVQASAPKEPIEEPKKNKKGTHQKSGPGKGTEPGTGTARPAQLALGPIELPRLAVTVPPEPDVWERILGELERSVDRESFHLYYRPLRGRLIDSAGNGLVVQVPNEPHQDYVRDHQQEVIAAAAAIGVTVSYVQYVLHSWGPAAVTGQPAQAKAARAGR